MSNPSAVSNVLDQAAQRSILLKLIIFSVSLAIGPLSAYFISRDYIFNGNTTYAAMMAVFAANAVLAMYIASSIIEDNQSASSSTTDKTDSKKNQ